MSSSDKQEMKGEGETVEVGFEVKRDDMDLLIEMATAFSHGDARGERNPTANIQTDERAVDELLKGLHANPVPLPNENTRVLDLGCGSGSLSKAIIKFGSIEEKQITGIDINPDRLKTFSDDLPGSDAIEWDVMDPDSMFRAQSEFNQNRFGFILCNTPWTLYMTFLLFCKIVMVPAV